MAGAEKSSQETKNRVLNPGKTPPARRIRIWQRPAPDGALVQQQSAGLLTGPSNSTLQDRHRPLSSFPRPAIVQTERATNRPGRNHEKEAEPVPAEAAQRSSASRDKANNRIQSPPALSVNMTQVPVITPSIQTRPVHRAQGATAIGATPVGKAPPTLVMRDLLEGMEASERQQLQVDTATVPIITRNFLRGQTFPLPPGLTFQHDGEWAVHQQLQHGLSAMAVTMFNLWPQPAAAEGSAGGEQENAPPPQENSVRHHIIDLSHTPAHGPINERFRFTVHGSTILIEDLGLASADPAPLTPEQAAQYGFTQMNAFFGGLWSQVLAALGHVPDAMLRQIQDTPFQELTGAGPEGQAAEYEHHRQGTVWTRQINIYRQAAEARRDEFATLLVHEIGHAISQRPMEDRGAGGSPSHYRSHDPAFRTAGGQDGGLARAITDYGAQSWEEYYGEAYTQFVHNPDTLLRLRPHVHAYFTQLTAELGQNAPEPAHPDARPQQDPLSDDALSDDALFGD